jgi:LysR family transcriptional regulator, hydrogen peroxide-inducible genes activator
MNLRDLSYLVALADHRNFSRAAQAVHVTQPTLSMQLKKLEDELGVQLVERSHKALKLTRVGSEILEHARTMLREARFIKEVARRAVDPESGALKLGVFPTLAPYLLPHVVPALVARFPRKALYLTEEKTARLLSLLKEGEIDAALLALPVDDRALNALPLFDEPFVFAAPRADPALANGAPLTLKSLSEEKLLLLEDGHCLREQALAVCALTGAREQAGFRATSLETLRQMVAAGIGSTLLPKLATLPPVAQSPAVGLREFTDPQPHRQIGLLWRVSADVDELMQALADAITGAVNKVLA